MKGRDEVLAFITAHRQCDQMYADLGTETESGFQLLLACGCGIEFKRWVRPDGEGLRLVLLAL